MANAKFIDAATWASLPEIDVTNGEDLFPQLAAGTYRPVLSGVDSAVIPALTAGAIVQATPTVGDTLTVSGSNATGSATFQWQRDTGGGQADISGATSATYDTTGQAEGDYRRGVSDGVQGPVYTAAVTLGAAATAPATMSAPTVTATSDTEISVDRAAAPADGGSAILSYDLRHSTDESSWTTVTGISDPQTVAGLTASTLYYVQTRAVNAVGAGAWSASGSATTEAASGFSFSDDFGSTYHTLGNALTVSGLYTNINGFRPIKSKDSGGTRVAAQDTGTAQNEILTYTGATVPQTRKVSLTVRNFRDGAAGKVFRLYGAYTDSNNHVDVNLDTGGYVGIYHKVAGVNSPGVSVGPGVMSEGDTISVELNGASMSVKINGSHIGASPYTVTPPGGGYGPPGFFQEISATTTEVTEFTLFDIEEL